MSIFDKFKNYDESDEINKENKGRKNMINLKITRPTKFEEARSITDSIINKDIVIFSLENLTQEEGQRLIDFISGATYAQGGKIEKITDKVLASVPDGVEISEYELNY